jgi:hypothetical protein
MLLRAEYPCVELLLGVPHLRPSPVLFGVRVDFTNYDADPPSVRLVNPWNGNLLTASELISQLFVCERLPDIRPLIQAWPPPNDTPFVCARGIREYHRNPGHSGDSWWLHRRRGEGTLGSIVDLLCKYGPEMIANYTFDLQLNQLPNGGIQPVGAQVRGFAYRSKAGEFFAPHGTP